jgi:hypothetical protein
MPKVYRTFNGVTSLLNIPTTLVQGELIITITESIGTEEAKTLSFGVRADIAEVLIKALFQGMKIDDPETVRPIFKLEP